MHEPGDVDERFAILGSADLARYMPASWTPPTRERVAANIPRHVQRWRDDGFGEWAVIHLSDGKLIGYCGLQHIEFVKPEIEIFYGFARDYWGRGLATEAARAALRYGFEQLKLAEIVAATHPGNVASQRVLQKIGLRRDRDGRFFEPDSVCFTLRRDEYVVPVASPYALRFREAS